MSTSFSLPMKSMVSALVFLILFYLPELSSAAHHDFFKLRSFSAAEFRLSLGFSTRSSAMKVSEYELSSSTAAKSEKPQLSLARNESDVAAATSSSSSVSAVTHNAKAVRGVRKLLFGALSCAPQDLSLTQGPVSSTSGIPTFNVQIVNLCGACAMADIHVACGNWASATPVDPFVFTRLGYNDCLVNNGQPLSSQGSVSFQYSNSAMYPMSIATATNECSR